MILYRKVSCSERLPDTTNFYDTENGVCKYDGFTRSFFDDDMNRVYPIFWYEPIQLPTDEDAVNWIIQNILRNLSPEKQKEVTKFLLSRKMIDLPTDEEIEKIISELQKGFHFGFDIDSWKSGFKSALELLTNKN